MAWLKIDDQYFFNRKVLRAGRDARDLHLAGMAYCAGQLSDGAIDPENLPLLGAMAIIPDAEASAAKLVEVGLWDIDGDGWQIHDYLEYNPTRETVTAKRAEAKERMRGLRGLRSPEVRANNERTTSEVQRLPSPSPSPSPIPNPVEEAVPDNGSDPELITDRARVFRAIASAGIIVNSFQSEHYSALLEDFDIEAISLAFAEAKKQGKPPRWQYLRAILERCKEYNCQPGEWPDEPNKAEPEGEPYARDGPLETFWGEDNNGNRVELTR